MSGSGRGGKLRHIAPILLGLGLFGLGLWAMHHLLAQVHPGDILRQMRATPWHILLIALIATALGYTALIGYDFWALKFLEKKLPLRVVALGGFLGYAFGNTIGVSVLSGGAVRYRIYSAFGLNAFEVAALASYIAIAMGTGLSLVGVLALGLHPAALSALVPFPEHTIRLLAILGGGGTLALLYALAFSGRTLKIRRFELSMPNPKILTGQMVVALFDSTMAALTLYVLMPEGAPDFVTFLAIYAAATMVGVLSHVPGGVGVFETVMMAAMPPGTNPGEVAAALLMFRMIYFLLPFTIAFVVVSLNEARLAGGWAVRVFGEISEPMRPAFSALSGIVPWLAGAWAFGLGAYMIAVSLMPSVRAVAVDDNDLVGAVLLEGGTLASAVAGIVLLILSHGLVRRVAGAYWLTLVAIGGGAIAAIFNNLDIESAILLALAGGLLLPFKHEFYRQTPITRGVFGPAWIGMVLAVIAAAASFFYFLHAAPGHALNLTDFALSANTPRALRAAVAASAVLLFFTVFLALRPLRRESETPSEARDRAERIVAAQNEPFACLAFTGDKELLFSEDGRAFVMYGRRRADWIALGGPVGPADAAAGWAFLEAARKANFRPVFYELAERHLPLMVEMGLACHRIGDEAVVRLADMPPAPLVPGLEIHQPPHSAALLAECRTVSQAWLADPVGREKGFVTGPCSEAWLDRFPLAVLRREGRIVAFANLLAPGAGRKMAADLLRYLPSAGETPLIEEFLHALLLRARADGVEEFSLGIAPLADLGQRRMARLWIRFGNILFRHGGAFPDVAALRAFKARFRPQWRPRYIALPAGVSPMVAMADVAWLIAGERR